MSRRLPVSPTPEPLEAYAQHFDPLFTKRNQRDAFRRYLEGLLLPTERNKTLTALANTEPVLGAQHPSAQGLQWFLSESTWQPQAVNTQRLHVLRSDLTTAPDERGVLIVDETGDRKDGKKTAHVGRQYLANLGKTDNGVVSVSTLWADDRIYYPLEVEPYTPAYWFAQGKADPAFRMKPQIAVELVERAVNASWPFRAVVADAFYGENETFHLGLHRLQVGFVVALKPSHAWWHPIDEVGSLVDVATAAPWKGPAQPGGWEQIVRRFRDGHTEDWWALERHGASPCTSIP
jgi:SRSO17 transposase